MPPDTAHNQRLLRIAQHLDKRGENAVILTHRLKLHLLSSAQIREAARSSYQPLLAQVLTGFQDIEAMLWGLVYTAQDPGFYCFN